MRAHNVSLRRMPVLDWPGVGIVGGDPCEGAAVGQVFVHLGAGFGGLTSPASAATSGGTVERCPCVAEEATLG